MDPAKYGNMFKGMSVTMKEEGVRALGKGWAPTFFGYSMQGLCKFGFYEVFKIFYANLMGEVLDEREGGREGRVCSIVERQCFTYHLITSHMLVLCRSMPIGTAPVSISLPLPALSSLQT